MDEEHEVEERQESNSNKCVFVIIVIYFMLYFVSRDSNQQPNQIEQLMDSIKDQTKESISPNFVLKSLTGLQFEGKWTSNDGKQNSNFLSMHEGTFLSKIMHDQRNDGFYVKVRITNGHYVDDGIILGYFNLMKNDQWETIHEKSKLTLLPKQHTKLNFTYIQEKIFQSSSLLTTNISAFTIHLEIDGVEGLKQTFRVQGLEEQNQIIQLKTTGQKSYVVGIMSLFVLFFFISFIEFHSLVKILKRFFEGTLMPNDFSYWTILIALMWDATFCMMTFILAINGSSNESLILLMIPAFIFCILFSNVQPRLLVEIYRARFDNNANVRNIMCKFHVITYASVIVIYPILSFCNLNNLLFVGLSLMFIPQIYKNAINGKRPQPFSTFYREFLLARFLFILYLKCFPYNYFEFRPNYILSFGCVALIICQFALLWVQKKYGPRKVLPKFLLPEVFDYQYEHQINIEENTESIQCSICLNGLHEKAPESNDEKQISDLPKIMKTPCQHLYHGVCLTNWMTIKMECPQCRHKLPPYE